MEIIVEPVFMFKPYHHQQHQSVDVLLRMKQLQRYLHFVSASSRPAGSHRFLLTLSFADERFRKRYRSAIYAEYSRSRANWQMIRNNEHAVLIKWAQAFNQARRRLKIVQIHSEVNQNSYGASCQVLDLSSSPEQLSDPAYLYRFAGTETKRLIRIMQTVFNRCVPGMTFQFRGRSLSYLQASDLIEKTYRRSRRSEVVHSAHHDSRPQASSSVRSQSSSSASGSSAIASSGYDLEPSKSSVLSQSSAASASLSGAMSSVASWRARLSQQARRSSRSVAVKRSSSASSLAASRSARSSARASGRQRSLRSAGVSLRRSSQARSATLSAAASARRASASSAARRRLLIGRRLQIHSSQTITVAQHYFDAHSVEPRSVAWFIGCVIVTVFVMVLLLLI